jgi:hypothetical protein
MLIQSESFARYHRMGFSPRPVRGKGDEQDFAVAYYFDNVQYVFNDYGTYEEDGNVDDMNMTVLNLDYIINSDRHEKVKAVADHIQQQLRVPIWCEIALDTQLGISFGSSSGIIAQMIMDFPTKEKFEDYKAKLLEQLKSLSPDLDLSKLPPIEDVVDFILIPSESEYDILFKDLKVDGVIVENLDDDDFYIEINLDDDPDDDDEE